MRINEQFICLRAAIDRRREKYPCVSRRTQVKRREPDLRGREDGELFCNNEDERLSTDPKHFAWAMREVRLPGLEQGNA